MIKKYLRKDINLRKKSDEFNQPSKFRAKNWVKSLISNTQVDNAKDNV